MSAREVPAPASSGPGSPFLVFGLVAAAAAVGAVWEMSYYAGNSALSSGVLGTVTGIILALLAFFAWGLRAPPNE